MIEKLFSKDAVILAVITALAYFYAFVFDIGYIWHFGVPTRLESVTTQSILLFGSVMLVVVLAAGDFSTSIIQLLLSPKIRHVLLGLSYVVPAFVAFVLVFVLGSSIWWKAWTSICAVGTAYFFILYPFLTRNESGGYLQALKVKIEETHAANQTPQRLRRLFGPENYTIALLALFVVPMVAFLLGSMIASSQSSFSSIQRDGIWLYVTGGQGQLIFSGFDPNSNSLNGKILILSGKELEALALQNIDLAEAPIQFRPKN